MSLITEYKDEDGDIFRVIVPGPRPSAPARAAAPAAIDLSVPLLGKNDRLAALNRGFFRDNGIVAINLVSSPGSGKTALLERTLDDLGREVKCAVLVGDLETDRDAQRLRRDYAPVAQITTGSACHLDAEMVARGAEALDLEGVRLLFIENVGNLVCPAAFDLGEATRVVLLSTTEGEDKPLKYPPIFKSAQVVLVTKTDLVQPLGFDLGAALGNIRRIAPQARVLTVSSRTGEGMAAWYGLLRAELAARRAD
jgi:hydrogenase nickel incorporation protein HypB